MVNPEIESRRSKAARHWLPMVLTITAILLGASLVDTAKAQEPHPGMDYPKTIDPWEIIIYEHPDYTGTWIRYKMEPGMRQRLVPQIYPGMEDKVTSIQIGSNVGVVLFAGPSFHGGDGSDYKYFDQSVTKVEVDFRVGALVVYPKAANVPLGVWLWDERSGFSGFPMPYEISFFPLPESETISEQGYEFLGRFNLDKNANVIDLADIASKAVPASTSANIEAVLYEERDFGGTPLTLPGSGGWESMRGVNLGKFSWSDRPASLKVRWKGPPLALGPAPPATKAVAPPAGSIQQGVNLPGRDYRHFLIDGGPEDCKAACNNEQPNCKAFTWVKPGVQDAKAVCWLKSSVPAPTNDPNCASGFADARLDSQTIRPEFQKMQPLRVFETEYGINRPGGDYKNFPIKGESGDCEQACAKDPKCKAYTWIKEGAQGPDAVCWLKSSVTLPVYNSETVSGVLSKEKAALPPEYQKPSQPQTPAQQPPGPQPPKATVPDISGTWQSSIGLTYQIVQTGEQFTWTVAQPHERAAGKLRGNDLTVDWVSETAKGSAIGKVTIVDATGRAMRIEWNNGAVVFFR